MRARFLVAAGAVGLLWAGLATVVAASSDPDISVRRGDTSAEIADGGTYAMGTTTVGVPFTQYLVVGNSTGVLTIASITVPAGFTMTQAPPSTIMGGASHGLNLRCNAAAVGDYTGQVVIVSDDPDEGSFEVNVSCSVVAAGSPTIRMVTGGGVPVADGGSLTLAPGAGVLMRVYNDEGSTGPLNLSAPTLVPAGASLGSYIPDSVISVNGASTYFNVRCATALNSSGLPVTGTFGVSVGNNVVGSENPYTFTVFCTDDEPPVTDPPVTDPPTTDPSDTDPPDTDPPDTDPAATDPTATVTTIVGGSGAGVTTTSPSRALPTTGRSGLPAAIGGGVLLAVGLLVVRLVRRPVG